METIKTSSNTVQTATHVEKAETREFWQSKAGHDKIMGYLAQGWCVSLDAHTLTRTKTAKIPSL